ncbi:hypothetical protein BASA81_012888 [Batrachochytrium salamandrivorans]|nr:hypothetical protein BASA81_012888 [Batrachochytrium salamandrivorans]
MLFVIGTTGIVGLLLVYFATEGWAVLHAPQREFFFWVFVLTCETGLLLLSRDSPVRSLIGDASVKATPMQLVTFFGLAVPTVSAYVLSWKFMKELLPYNPTRSLRESHFFAFKTPVSAKAKQGEVNAILERLSYKSHIRYFIAHFRGRLRERQDKLKEIFENANAEELNFFIRTSNIPMLLQYGDLLGALTARGEGGLKTLSQLNPLPKAVLMHGLMKIGTLPFTRSQREWVRTMFLHTTGDELTVLKMHLDGSTDFHNLYKLLYTDFAMDDELRSEILAHFQVEASKILKLNAEKHLPKTVKVLSDVDDTLWCSAGKWPAGIDRSLPSHQVYPGVLSLYEEIDHRGFLTKTSTEETDDADLEPEMVQVTVQIPYERGGGTASLRINAKESIEQVQRRFLEQFKLAPKSQRLTVTASKFSSQGTNTRGHNLVFLSARPHAFKDFAESSSYARFKKLFEEGRMHTHPTLLAGNLRSGANAMWGDITRRVRTNALQSLQLACALYLSLDEKYLRGKHPRAKQFAEKWASEEMQLAMINAEGGVNANWHSVGRFKAETFERFHKLYPECEFLFLGDDGQGDVLASEMMSPWIGGTTKQPVALIHRVAEDVAHVLTSLPADLSPEDKQRKWKEMGIYFFDTYVGAGTILLDLGLVAAQVVHHVGVAAREELVEMMLVNPAFDKWPNAIELLNKDIAKANESIKRACKGNPSAPQIELAASPF